MFVQVDSVTQVLTLSVEKQFPSGRRVQILNEVVSFLCGIDVFYEVMPNAVKYLHRGHYWG